MITITPEVTLAQGRAHEAAGPSRHVFALLTAAALTGPILWLRPTWAVGGLMADGVRPWLDPGRLLFGKARTGPELLQTAETALRSGLIPLVISELPALPSLTAVRRLHLAAENPDHPDIPPTMLILSPELGGAPGVETRWHLAPMPGWAKDGYPRWRLHRLRARAAPEKGWEMWRQAGQIHLTPLAA